MSILHYDENDKVERFAEASSWEAGFAVREGTNVFGFGFFLWDENGKPIASCVMTPEQALAQGQYLVENALRMMDALKEMQSVALQNIKLLPPR